MKENLTMMLLTLERKDNTTFTIEGYYFGGRIRKTQVPEGYYKVSLRHSDEDWGDIATVERWVMVNHYGDLLMKNPLEFPEDGYYVVKDWEFDDNRSLEYVYNEI